MIGTPLTVMRDARAHLAIQRLAGGDVDDGQGAVAGEFFGQAAFAGAGTAED